MLITYGSGLREALEEDHDDDDDSRSFTDIDFSKMPKKESHAGITLARMNTHNGKKYNRRPGHERTQSQP